MASSTRDRKRNEERKAKAKSWADRQKNFSGGGSKAVRLPEGCEWYKLEASKEPIDVDIMPYRVGKGNPAADEGEIYCDREFTVHKIPTPNSTWGEPHACLWENFREPCPVCKHQQRVADPDLAKQLRGQTRHLFIFNDKPGSKKFTPKIFDIHHFQRGEGFPEKLTDAINVDPEKFGDFSDLENGFTLRLTVKDQPMGDGGKRPGIVRIDFVPRDYSYPEDLLDRMPCLDDCIIHEDAHHLADLLEGGAERNGKPKDDERAPAKAKKKIVDEDEDEDEDDDVDSEIDDEDNDEPVAKKKKPAKNDDDEENDNPHAVGLKIGDLVTYKGMQCEILGIGSKGLLLEDDDGEEHDDVPAGKVKKIKTAGDKDDDEDEPPAKKGGKKKPVVDEDEDDPDDEDASPLEDEEDDDDEPPAKKKTAKASSKRSDPDDEEDDDD